MNSLVDTAWLAQASDAPDLRILDASLHLPASGRDARAEFAAAHIPGAGFLDLATLIDPASDVPAAVPTRAIVAERLRSLGVAPGDRIVLYDNSPLRSAARAWFVLRLCGWREVALLDGGFEAWQAAGLPVEAGTASVQPSNLTEADLDSGAGTVRSKAEMLRNLDSRAEQIVDARDADRFAGAGADSVHGVPAGHIPGSRDLYFRELLRDDGTFRSDEELRARFAKAGLDTARPIVASCGSGVTASVLLFALDRLGATQTALYDGSWSEWGADPATPKETGPAAKNSPA